MSNNLLSHNSAGMAADEGDDGKNSMNDQAEVIDKRADAGVAAGKTARTFVTLDVKPWGMLIRSNIANSYEFNQLTELLADDTTDMHELESSVRKIEHDGLVWGVSQMIAVGFGVRKLQINLIVEDEKVSVTDLQEEVETLEEYVQSSDVVAMQKL